MKRLDAIANTANDGLMLPEQVWDDNPPSGTDGRLPGTGTGSATPLGWTHAQFIRLAWSIDAGRPVESQTWSAAVTADRVTPPFGEARLYQAPRERVLTRDGHV